MSQGIPRVLLITEQSPQMQLFTHYLRERLKLPVTSFGPDDLPKDIASGKSLALLDADHIDKGCMYLWNEQVIERLSLILAAFNLRNEEHAADILSSLQLQGVFYRHDELTQFCKGISALLEGRLWLSRPLMSRLIDFYRCRQFNLYRPNHGLTRRELEIISLLGSGESNAWIANKLFVSEHTVRAHLYNIFRKIRVYNRFQAMSWAQRNLCVAPTAPTKPLPEARKP